MDTENQLNMCRFIKDPSPECYCMAMSGANIKKIVALCADDYHACPIYHKRTQSAATALPALPGKEQEISL